MRDLSFIKFKTVKYFLENKKIVAEYSSELYFRIKSIKSFAKFDMSKFNFLKQKVSHIPKVIQSTT